MYIIPIQIYMHKFQLKKKKKKNTTTTTWGCKRDFMERPLANTFKF